MDGYYGNRKDLWPGFFGGFREPGLTDVKPPGSKSENVQKLYFCQRKKQKALGKHTWISLPCFSPSGDPYLASKWRPLLVSLGVP
jgi:hypothetical protein